MPSIDENRRTWDRDYDWAREGDEWSDAWGGVESQWYGTIYPRIQAFLPVPTILEIAPGHGRWTTFLKDLCRTLVVVDLSDRCVEACKRRFAQSPHLVYHVNDGRSLDMLDDSSIDFACSFDSLVHADRDALESYIGQLSRKLTPEGVGFFHHSNVGAFVDCETGELTGSVRNLHWRSEDVSAASFAAMCGEAEMRCISQELVNWGTDFASDVFSVFVHAGSCRANQNLVVENLDFMDEAARLSALSALYSRGDELAAGAGEPVREFAARQGEIEALRAEIAMMRRTRAWRMGVCYWKVRDLVKESLRRGH